MTEAEWLGCEDPERMFQGPARPILDYDRETWQQSKRRRKLFCAACAQLVSNLIVAEESRRALAWLEESVDEEPPAEERADVVGGAKWAAEGGRDYDRDAEGVAAELVCDAVAGDVELVLGYLLRSLEDALPENVPSRVAGLMRDIVGNPFRPVTLDPRWLTPNVVALAQTIYDERAFERMPILADALMDAGCDSADVLEHCRKGGEHVRGCWVVDLLLGKE